MQLAVFLAVIFIIRLVRVVVSILIKALRLALKGLVFLFGKSKPNNRHTEKEINNA